MSWMRMHIVVNVDCENRIKLFQVKRNLENAGIDPATSRMLSERSTIWANSPSIGLANP